MNFTVVIFIPSQLERMERGKHREKKKKTTTLRECSGSHKYYSCVTHWSLVLLWQTMISPLKGFVNPGSPGVHHPFAEMTLMWQMVQIAWHAL